MGDTATGRKMVIAALLIVASLVVYFAVRPSGSGTREIPHNPPKMVITAPTLGILNLEGQDATATVDADRHAFGQLFLHVAEQTEAPPRCDVLLIYCHVGLDGRLRNTDRSLREIIRDSGAKIVIVASENEANAYIKAGRVEGYGRANMAMTLTRNGASFGTFYARLFGDMFNGTTMPVAWERLAPQIPGASHIDAPDAIFACELGQIAFR